MGNKLKNKGLQDGTLSSKYRDPDNTKTLMDKDPNKDRYERNHPYTANYKIYMLRYDLRKPDTNELYTVDELAAFAGISRSQFRNYYNFEAKYQNIHSDKKVYKYDKVPLKVKISLARNLHIPLEYFVRDSIPYTDRPQDLLPYRDYHKIPLSLRVSNEEKGKNFLTDLQLRDYERYKKSAQKDIEDIEFQAGLIPEVIHGLSEESKEELTNRIKTVVEDVLRKEFEKLNEVDSRTLIKVTFAYKRIKPIRPVEKRFRNNIILETLKKSLYKRMPRK